MKELSTTGYYYSFGTKEPVKEKDSSVVSRLARMKENFEKEGLRKTVEAIIIVHNHNHPHILLLKIANTFFKLPGGKLKPGENEIDGLIRKLTKKLSPIGTSVSDSPWEVGENIATWWRPNFEQILYPYIPPHITKPKECKKLYVVTLPEKCTFAVPSNLELIAVPLFEIYNNSQRYGAIISSIPQLISKYHYVYLSLDA
ncbi:NUDIX hydrolase family protein [Heterostelium album PN500]|uniref:Cleavage and polyadenylation specificity factor subunit 5 n=1 Tax=Heterostelium pallidum (strain ATCC 26659 / Pp 5 / PN500) TaxID=670386 RepID=D3BCE5_HETP5|nr:NUDIX hydrolase family protein [Heterostelium album PN500]EFA80935.1 NUDIX hydrolase family protein [Heterostelium album PN500]|eukprot:XP_020433053.1 NUDIX hydrolase family protein [Heterostelium album PN500]